MQKSNSIVVKEFREDGIDEFIIPVIGKKYDMLVKDGDIDFYVDGILIDSWTITENALITPPILRGGNNFLAKLFGNFTDWLSEKFLIDIDPESGLVGWFMDKVLFATIALLLVKHGEKHGK